jgi:hypothetical protein
VELFLPHLKMVDMVTTQRITVWSGPGICLAIGERKAVLSECRLKTSEVDIFVVHGRGRRLPVLVLGDVSLQNIALGGTPRRSWSGTCCSRYGQHCWWFRRHRRRRLELGASLPHDIPELLRIVPPGTACRNHGPMRIVRVPLEYGATAPNPQVAHAARRRCRGG